MSMGVPTKLFVGNLPESCRKQELIAEFEHFGKVVEFDIVKNYAFVHFEDCEEAKAAVEALHNSDFQGSTIKVEMSHSKVRQKPGMGGTNECFRCGKRGHWSKDCPTKPPGAEGGGHSSYYRGFTADDGPTKLYVGNLPEPCRKQDLQAEFENYGTVVECDIVKNYAFVHFSSHIEAKAAVAGLDNQEFGGSKLKVELSHSKVRQKPGMGGMNECIRCGKRGHWSKDCPTRAAWPREPLDDLYPPPPLPDLYRDPYRDAYEELRERYATAERYRPYPSLLERRRLAALPSARDLYLRDKDPYARPPPDYYRRSPPRDPLLDLYYSRRYPLPTPSLRRLSPPPPRVPY